MRKSNKFRETWVDKGPGRGRGERAAPALGGHGHGLGVAGQWAVQNIKDQFLTSLVTRGIERQSRLCCKYRLKVEKQHSKKPKETAHLCPLA